MNAAGEASRALRLVVFSAGGVTFGADADQVAAIGVAPEKTLSLRRILSGEPSPEEDNPESLLIRGSGVRIGVDGISNISEFEIGRVRPLPELIEPHAGRNGIWGAIADGDGILLLIDLQRFAAGRAGKHP